MEPSQRDGILPIWRVIGFISELDWLARSLRVKLCWQLVHQPSHLLECVLWFFITLHLLEATTKTADKCTLDTRLSYYYYYYV